MQRVSSKVRMIKVEKKKKRGGIERRLSIFARGGNDIIDMEGAVLTAAARKSINNCTRLGGTLVVINGLYRYVDW